MITNEGRVASALREETLYKHTNEGHAQAEKNL
jgi:hypothetical protein